MLTAAASNGLFAPCRHAMPDRAGRAVQPRSAAPRLHSWADGTSTPDLLLTGPMPVPRGATASPGTSAGTRAPSATRWRAERVDLPPLTDEHRSPCGSARPAGPGHGVHLRLAHCRDRAREAHRFARTIRSSRGAGLTGSARLIDRRSDRSTIDLFPERSSLAQRSGSSWTAALQAAAAARGIPMRVYVTDDQAISAAYSLRAGDAVLGASRWPRVLANRARTRPTTSPRLAGSSHRCTVNHPSPRPSTSAWQPEADSQYQPLLACWAIAVSRARLSAARRAGLPGPRSLPGGLELFDRSDSDEAFCLAAHVWVNRGEGVGLQHGYREVLSVPKEKPSLAGVQSARRCDARLCRRASGAS